LAPETDTEFRLINYLDDQPRGKPGKPPLVAGGRDFV
jgi:hypothetical protein